MKLRDLLHLNLGALACGKVVIDEPLPRLPGKKRSWWRHPLFGRFRRQNKTQNLILVTEQLRQLVACQVPLAEGLKHAATDCPSLPVSANLYRLAVTLEQGGTLAKGLRQSPALCPRYYVDLVEAAGTSEQLNETLLELSNDLEQDLKTSHMLRSRTVYILLVLILALAFGAFLGVKVFPVLEDIGAELGSPTGGTGGWGRVLLGSTGFLHGPASSLMRACAKLYDATLGMALKGLSSQVRIVGVLIVASLALLLLAFVVLPLLRRPAKFVLDRLPVVRTAVFSARWSHVLKVISLLLGQGVPLDQALESAAGSDLDRSTHRTLLRMSAKTRAGLSFPEALQQERRGVPRSIHLAIAFGVHTGRLPEMLSQLSHVYRLRAERTLRVALDIAFPLAIIGCGSLVYAINSRYFVLMTDIIHGIMSDM